MAAFLMTLNDPLPRFQGHGVTINDLDVLCAQLTRDLFAIAKFLVSIQPGRVGSPGQLLPGRVGSRVNFSTWFQLWCA